MNTVALHTKAKRKKKYNKASQVLNINFKNLTKSLKPKILYRVLKLNKYLCGGRARTKDITPGA